MTDNENNASDDASTPTSTPDTAGEQLRNLTDLKTAIDNREKWKTKATEAKDENKLLKEQVTELSRKQKTVDGEFKSVFDDISQENAAMKDENQNLRSMIESFERDNAVKQFTDEALKTVRNRDRAETMLLGLAAKGQINLQPTEDMATAAANARKLLEDLDPGLFAADNASNVPGGSGITGQGIRNGVSASKAKPQTLAEYVAQIRK